MGYGLRTLLIATIKNRVQITLCLGCIGMTAATLLWLCGGDLQNSTGYALRLAAVPLGVVSVFAIIEGVWKLSD